MVYRARTGFVVQRLLTTMLCGGLAFVATSIGAAPAVADRDAEQRYLVEQLTADKAISVARERRLADADQVKLYQQLAAKDRAQRAAEAQAAGNSVALARVRAARDQIAQQRRALVATMTTRDKALAEQVAEYRQTVTGIAFSSDPREQRALQRFASGHQREALAEFDRIADARRAARENADEVDDAGLTEIGDPVNRRSLALMTADIADAAARRAWAVLALQAQDEGKLSLPEVARRFEQLVRLDPAVTWPWIVLSLLYDRMGRLADARKAARSAETSALDKDATAAGMAADQLGKLAVEAGDLTEAAEQFRYALTLWQVEAFNDPDSVETKRDIVRTLRRLGEVNLALGDQRRAESTFAEALVISRQLAEADPDSDTDQRELAISLQRFGDASVQAGDLRDARARFEEALAIGRALARASPESTETQRDLGLGLGALGAVLLELGDLQGARTHIEDSVAIARRVVRADATSAVAQRDLGMGLLRSGDVAAAAGDAKTARIRFDDSLRVLRKIARDNPGSAAAQRDLRDVLDRVGDAALKAGDVRIARARFEEALPITRKLAPEDTYSSIAERRLLLSLFRLGRVAHNRALLTEALAMARRASEEDGLAPEDRHLLDAIPELLSSIP